MCVITLHSTMDLIYSDQSGWRIRDTELDRTSIFYNSKHQALDAYKADNIQWSDKHEQ
jgi:hypothetical protein